MPTDTFDSDTWKAQHGVRAPDNKRVGMVSALEAAVRVGMVRTDVIKLLGEPDAQRRETSVDVYMLGLAMGPDEQYFEIRYEDGKVASLYLGQY